MELLTGTAAEVRARRAIVGTEGNPYLHEEKNPVKAPSITATSMVKIDDTPEAACRHMVDFVL